jgi:hypothetical protein
MRLIEQNTYFWPFPCEFDIALATRYIANDSCTCEYSLKLTTLSIDRMPRSDTTKKQAIRYVNLFSCILHVILMSFKLLTHVQRLNSACITLEWSLIHARSKSFSLENHNTHSRATSKSIYIYILDSASANYNTYVAKKHKGFKLFWVSF